MEAMWEKKRDFSFNSLELKLHTTECYWLNSTMLIPVQIMHAWRKVTWVFVAKVNSQAASTDLLQSLLLAQLKAVSNK